MLNNGCVFLEFGFIEVMVDFCFICVMVEQVVWVCLMLDDDQLLFIVCFDVFGQQLVFMIGRLQGVYVWGCIG